MTDQLSPDPWQQSLYDDKHAFVWKMAASVVELLDPQEGEQILDVGCGTGQLTSQIAQTGAKVVGLDQSAAMIKEATRLFPELTFVVEDVHNFQLPQTFDALFSNAALHWIKRPDEMAGSLAKALRRGGRLVVEFGGAGNVLHLTRAIEQAFRSSSEQAKPHPWYFPDIAEFSTLLHRYGFEVTQAAIIDRPTVLEGIDGLRNWVRMFGTHWLDVLPTEQHESFFAALENIARPTLFKDGTWVADYRRIRVKATKVQ